MKSDKCELLVLLEKKKFSIGRTVGAGECLNPLQQEGRSAEQAREGARDEHRVECPTCKANEAQKKSTIFFSTSMQNLEQSFSRLRHLVQIFFRTLRHLFLDLRCLFSTSAGETFQVALLEL